MPTTKIGGTSSDKTPSSTMPLKSDSLDGQATPLLEKKGDLTSLAGTMPLKPPLIPFRN